VSFGCAPVVVDCLPVGGSYGSHEDLELCPCSSVALVSIHTPSCLRQSLLYHSARLVGGVKRQRLSSSQQVPLSVEDLRRADASTLCTFCTDVGINPRPYIKGIRRDLNRPQMSALLATYYGFDVSLPSSGQALHSAADLVSASYITLCTWCDDVGINPRPCQNGIKQYLSRGVAISVPKGFVCVTTPVDIVVVSAVSWFLVTSLRRPLSFVRCFWCW
jgi:hypothetical protein